MDDATLFLLTLFKERHALTLIQLGAIIDADLLWLSDPVHYLMSSGYIRKCMEANPLDGDLLSPDTPLEITYKGLIAIASATKDRKHFKHTEFRAWATLLIAVIALALSILSLCLQYI